MKFELQKSYSFSISLGVIPSALRYSSASSRFLTLFFNLMTAHLAVPLCFQPIALAISVGPISGFSTKSLSSFFSFSVKKPLRAIFYCLRAIRLKVTAEGLLKRKRFGRYQKKIEKGGVYVGARLYHRPARAVPVIGGGFIWVLMISRYCLCRLSSVHFCLLRYPFH